MSRAKGLRRVRGFQAGAILFEAGDFLFEMFRGHVGFAFIPVVCAAAIAVAMLWLTGKIRQREYLDRPRPDYASIARMERDIYGRTFEHDGASRPSATDPQVAELHAMMDDLAERATARSLHRTHDRFARRLAEGPRHPDTTVPATIDQYAAWLRGYIKHGGKPTHFYDYPFKDFRYAASGPLVVESDYEYGANSREIIVARGVETRRTHPAGHFDGWAHTSLYFMHGYRTNKPGFVPVYSDPEFDFARETAPPQDPATEEGQ